VKTIIRATLAAAVTLAALSLTALPAGAATPCATHEATPPCADSLTSSSQMIRLNEDLPVFGIDLTKGTFKTKLSAVNVDFAQVVGGGDFSFSDLEASPDGVALWRDSSNATPATQDVFDAGDAQVSTSFTTSGLRATLNIVPAEDLPAAEEGAYTYFVTVRVSSGVSDGDNFTATLPSDAFQTSTLGTSITAVTSDPITADPSAPIVTAFSPAFAQTDNITWKLSEGVTGVTPSTVAFRLHDTATDLPATVSWSDATKTITLDPASPLTAGEYYDAILLPDGPGAIVDRAGNELAPDPQSFRAATDVSETAYGTKYTWRNLANSSVYGGSYNVNNMAGSTATWTFSGRSVTWYTITDPYQGKAVVSIDGHTQPTVNNYSSTTKYKVARTYTGLSSGAHTIVIRVAGTKGSTAGKDTRVAVDAFKVGTLYYVTPNATFKWAPIVNSGAAGGSYLAAKFPSNEMSFTFRGDRVDWRTVLGQSMGRATVYIDGISRGIVDNYSGVTIAKFYRSYSVPDGVHTIRIVVYSAKNSLAKDFIVAVDGFVVG
jgi:Big-like domain-containing protein